MNTGKIIEMVKQVGKEKYPEEPQIADFCEKIILFERDNTSYVNPRYKEPYQQYLKEHINLDLS